MGARKRKVPSGVLPLPFMLSTEDSVETTKGPSPGTKDSPATPTIASDPFWIEYNRAFYEQRKSFLESERESAQSYARTMIALSSGALTLSVAFIREISPRPVADTLWFLHWAWVFFALALCSILGSFLSSQFAWRRAMEREDAAFSNADKVPNADRLILSTKILCTLCLPFFALGVACFLAFSINNFKGEKAMAFKPERPVTIYPAGEHRGSVPPSNVLPRPSIPGGAPAQGPTPTGQPGVSPPNAGGGK